MSEFTNGVIETKQTFNFTPRSYTFSFQQIANSLGGNGVQVDIGTLLNQTFITSLSITSESATFTVTSNVSAKIKLTQVGPSDALGSFIGQIRLVRNVASTLAIENGSTDNCSITGTGTFARSVDIEVKNNSTVTNRIHSAVPTSILPAFLFNPYCSGSSNNSCNSNSNNNSNSPNNNRNIAQNATVAITDSIMGNVVVGKNATVTFTAPRIYMRGMHVGDGASIRFTQSATIRICNHLDIQDDVSFNKVNSRIVTIYVEKKLKVDEGSDFEASVYSLDEIKIKGKSNNPVNMKGLYIADKVEAEDYVNFSWNTNTTCGTLFSKTDEEIEANESELITSYFDISVYPNPSYGAFNLKLISSSEEPFTVDVYDMNGKHIETISVDQSTLQSEFGETYANGMYFMVVKQGEQTKTLRLVKARR